MYTINRKSNFGGTEQVQAILHNDIVYFLCPTMFTYYKACFK